MNRKLIISIGGVIILLCLFMAVAPIPVYAAPQPVPIYTYKYVTAPHNLTYPASISIGCYNSGITTAIMTASNRSALGVSDLGTFSVQPYAFRGVSPALSEGAYAVEIARILLISHVKPLLIQTLAMVLLSLCTYQMIL